MTTTEHSDLLGPLRELVKKLTAILSKPVGNWTVEGHSIVHNETGTGPLIHDHAAHPQTLTLIADALNFCVKRQALHNMADELESLLPALQAEMERVRGLALEEAAQHVPTVKVDPTESWIVCSCGMQSFGSGKTWIEWWHDHICALAI